MSCYCQERPSGFASRILELQLNSYKNQDSQFTQKSQSWFLHNRKIKVCDRLYRNGNNSDLGRKQSIYMLCQNLLSNYQATSANHRSDSVLIHSCFTQSNVLLQGIGKMQSTVSAYIGEAGTGTQIKWQKSEVELQAAMDNTTAVPYLNGKGGNVSASCNKLAKEICNRVKGQDICNTASHVPRVKNTTVDLRSSIFTITKSNI